MLWDHRAFSTVVPNFPLRSVWLSLCFPFSVFYFQFSVFSFQFSVFCFLFSVFCSLQISVIVTQCRVLSTSTTGQVLWASGNSISSGQKTSADCSTIRKICLFSNCQISFQGTESDARWRISQWPTRTNVGRSDTRLFFSSWEKPDGQNVGNLFAVGIGEIESQDTLF